MEKNNHWWCKDCPHEKCPCPYSMDKRPCFRPADQCPAKTCMEVQ